MQPHELDPAASDGASSPSLITAPRDADPHAVAARLGIARAPAPVLVVSGGAGGLEGDALARTARMLGSAVPAAVAATGAIVLDGGTDAGVMRLVGAARAARPAALPVLVGVAPQEPTTAGGSDDAVALERHHTHIVVVESGTWGDETGLLLGLADALADGAPVVLLLAGGGDIALQEAAGAANRGWPIFALAGTDGVAGQLAGDDAEHAIPRVLTDGDVRLVREADADVLAGRLRSALGTHVVARQAWSLFHDLDRAAARLRRAFERFQIAIILVGLLATLLALLHQELGTQALRWAVVAAPIVASALVSVATRRAAGKRWVVLRAAAESIKSELFRYRTRTGAYAQDRADHRDRRTRTEVLAHRVAEIESRLSHTEASSAPIVGRRDRAEADGAQLFDLDAAGYLRERVEDQIDYYQARLRRLQRRRSALQVIAIVAGGAGALVAAAGAELWVALTTAIAAGPPAYLAYMQVDSTIVAYNQAWARLDAVARRWAARPASGRTSAAFDDLVAEVESVLLTELGGWMEQMVNAMRDLQERQQRAADQHARAA